MKILQYKICLVCEAKFYNIHKVSENNWKLRKYCSRKCSSIDNMGTSNSAYKHGNCIKKKKICPTCKKEFISVYKFCSTNCANKYRKKHNSLEDILKSRKKTLKRWKNRVHKNKELLVAYKGGKCEICGYNKCVAALDFHHKNPNEKHFNISHNRGRNIDELKKEVDKCTLLCANCHKELHYTEMI